MSPARWILSYLLTGVVFLAVDLLWLGVLARDLYRGFLGHLLAEEVNWPAAVVFYLVFIAGLFIFAIGPGVQRESWSHAVLMGALFGFFTYATYDLTNLATLKNWPAGIVFIDIPWGMVLSAVVSLAGYHVVRWVA